MCVFGVRRPLNKQVLPRRTLKPPRQSEGLGIWTSSLNHILGSPRCRVLKYLYVPLVCQVSHAFFFLLLLPCHFFFTSNTHTSTTVVVSGNIIQYWWWRTLKEHGPMGMKKKKLQQSIKIEQCITVMLNLEKQTYMSTQQKRAKKREREKKRNWHIKLEMHTLSPQWDICFFFHM